MKSHLQNILAIAVKFMRENGAMSNGHDTYLKGTAQIRHFGGLTYRTPKCDDLTGRAVASLARSLADSIQIYLKEHKLEEKFTFSTNDRGNICLSYTTTIEASL